MNIRINFLVLLRAAELKVDFGDIGDLREYLYKTPEALFSFTGPASKMSESLKLKDVALMWDEKSTQSVIFYSV